MRGPFSKPHLPTNSAKAVTCCFTSLGEIVKNCRYLPYINLNFLN